MDCAQKSPRWSNPEAYEAYMGRWSRPAAHAFLAWLAPPQEARWIDVGCGTGALTHAILTTTAPRDVIGIDTSEEFLAAAQVRMPGDRVRFIISSAETVPLPSDGADVVVAGLTLNLIPDYRAGLTEMTRLARTGGIVAAYVWDFAGEMQLVRLFWQAATALDPSASAFDQAVRFPICQPEPLQTLFGDAGLQDVRLADFTIPLPFRDFADYWEPQLIPGSSPVQRYIATLAEPQRELLRARLLAMLPIAADGSLHLSARAWTIRGTK